MANELKLLSKSDYNGEITIENINCGSLQRIADATELMASNYKQLQQDCDKYQRWYNEEAQKVNNLYRKISSLKGVITKYKNRLSKN